MSALPYRFYDLGGGVFRCAQPTIPEQWETLAVEYHVRHVIQLCFHSEEIAEHGAPPHASMLTHYHPMEPEGDTDLWDEVEGVFVHPDEAEAKIVDGLLAMATPEEAWVIHCIHGEDRTGWVSGRLRVNRDGWTKDRALAEEMVARGFHVELLGLMLGWERFRP